MGPLEPTAGTMRAQALATGHIVELTRLFGGVAERTIPGMTKAAKAVLADALRLREEERAELASEVLASLDGPADPDEGAPHLRSETESP